MTPARVYTGLQGLQARTWVDAGLLVVTVQPTLTQPCRKRSTSLTDPLLRRREIMSTEDPTGEIVTTASGLKYQVLTVGGGAEVKAGDTASMHYTGWLEDGASLIRRWIEASRSISPLALAG